MSFAEQLRTNTNTAYTANGALSNESTLSAILDFFSKSGALRGNKEIAIKMFEKAFAENKSLALKSLFYMRDIRGGQGERGNFREIIKHLSKKYPEAVARNIKNIPEYGRWDDLFSLFETSLENLTLDIIKEQLFADLMSLKSGRTTSLLAKWLPSENASSRESKRLARKIAESLELSPRRYRKILTTLRNEIKIVEQAMSKKDWGNIKYEAVPSQASRIYSNAFKKHDENRYSLFIEKVHSGEAKINAATLYPYDIVKKFMGYASSADEKVYDALWKSLPNYFEEETRAISVVDTSGSMASGMGSVKPIEVSVSLGIYFAERNVGAFKDYFITFSENPKMQKILGRDIKEKVENLSRADWGYNTDLQKVFDLILSTAVENNVPQNEMPNKLFIISDMQFDQACGRNDKTNLEIAKKKYEEAGYEIPEIVFWNVNALGDTPATKDEKGIFLISGCSPSILKNALNSIAATPMELMLEVLNSDRYKNVS